ncbi:MAG: ankyrin repeat domain-containing protein [Opitutales bacterium]
MNEDLQEDIIDAVVNGNLSFLKTFPSHDLTKMQTIAEYTLLHWAAQESQIEIISFLISIGCKVDAEDDCGHTPLQKACGEDSIEGVRLLLSAGADPNYRAHDQGTVLMTAVCYASPEIVELLIKSGALKDSQDDEGKSALDYARMHNRKKMIKMLQD